MSNAKHSGRILTNVDSEIQHVHKQYCKDHDSGPHTVGFWICTEDAQEASHQLFCPRQYHERHNCSRSTTDDKGSSFSPPQPTIVAFETDIGLDEYARERAGDPYEGEHGLADAKGEQVGLYNVS